MASQRHFSPGIYKEAGIPVLDIYGPSTQSYIDRICTTWIAQHAHDTPEQLNVELGIYRRRIAEVDERSCDGAAHRQHLADRALFLVIKEMLEHKKAPPKKYPRQPSHPANLRP